MATAKAFVNRSESGYSAAELQEALHVETKHCLLRLIRTRQLHRDKYSGCYIYFCADTKTYQSQLRAREQRKHKRFAAMVVANPDLAEEEAKAVVLLFLSSLDERQRRLFAGLESLKLGYGGDSYIADLFGMDPHTVSHGRQELEIGDWDTSRLRARGGGRKQVEKKPLKS
jgi:DNA-directed RNA polymerase specialized sigma24 family protein